MKPKAKRFAKDCGLCALRDEEMPFSADRLCDRAQKQHQEYKT